MTNGAFAQIGLNGDGSGVLLCQSAGETGV